MADKVQLIKQEIERRRKQLPKETEHKALMAVYGGIAYELTELLEFIDSLPEEHNEDLEREIGLYTTHSILKKRNHDTGVYHLTQNDCDNIARHFAEWQEKQMMKDAVEGVIDIRKWPAKAQVEFYDRLPIFNVETGDKVKIIIVKEEK